MPERSATPEGFSPDDVALVFDLDNTIIRCTEYYLEAQRDFVALMLTQFPSLTADEVLERLHAIDLAAVSGPEGFARVRYPSSMQATYRALCGAKGRSADPAVAAAAYAIGDSVFTAAYEPYDGAIAVLEHYCMRGVRLGLCTKGDVAVQEAKLRRHGLRRYFRHVRIVPRKSPKVIASVAQALTPDRPRQVYVVGDSLRDDILGGREAGLQTVWVTGNRELAWAYEHGFDHVQPTHTITAFRELPDVIPVRTTM